MITPSPGFARPAVILSISARLQSTAAALFALDVQFPAVEPDQGGSRPSKKLVVVPAGHEARRSVSNARERGRTGLEKNRDAGVGPNRNTGTRVPFAAFVHVFSERNWS